MKKKPKQINEKPLVSVVIPTYNRKEKLIRLIKSILKSNYPRNKLEIIVIDDASTDGTYEEVKKRFPEVKIIRNKKEKLVTACRNIGIKKSKGSYIFFIDDDNIVDKNCIKNLLDTIEKDNSVGIVAPIMYYYKQPNRVWCAGIKRNMVTSLTRFVWKDEIDNGKFKSLIESNDFPNAFMVKKEIIKKVGLFDDKNFLIHYEEADFGERVRRAGYKIVCNPKAKIWHDIPLSKDRLSHMHNELRAYYAARNRVIFHKKYSKPWQFLIFILIFNWLFIIYYLKTILFNSDKSFIERLRVAKSYLNGIFNGIKMR